MSIVKKIIKDQPAIINIHPKQIEQRTKRYVISSGKKYFNDILVPLFENLLFDITTIIRELSEMPSAIKKFVSIKVKSLEEKYIMIPISRLPSIDGIPVLKSNVKFLH